jgi:tRNA (guanosine-2'-O-)-methyltransferase
VRTCDAVGVGEVHAVWAQHVDTTTRGAARGSHHWVREVRHPDAASGLDAMRARGLTIVAASLADDAIDYREVDYTRPTCLLVGTEGFGLTDEVAALADCRATIPMHGMVDSLNVSVAAALMLYEACRQREAAGFYEARRLREPEYTRLLFEHAYPELSARCRVKGLPYPEMDGRGAILAPPAWWDSIRTA